jgi:hypothetical protein
VVLLVISLGNAVEGETALVDLKPYYNRLIYAKGDEVAHTTVDGSASRGQILGDLVTFLRDEVLTAAIGKGVIPTLDEQGQPSVGQIAWDQLFDLVDRVKATGKTVRLNAQAARETWSADTLDLTLVVGNPQRRPSSPSIPAARSADWLLPRRKACCISR